VIDHYTATLHVEENHVYSPQANQGDHWFWAQLSAPFTTTIPFTLTALVEGPAQITAAVWGNTEAPPAIDHIYRVLVNDQLLGEFGWDGQGPHLVEVDMPPGVLREGANTATLVLPGVKDVAADITFLNWLEVRYPRTFAAQDDRLAFDSPGGRHQLSGFSGPIDVFDVTRPDRITRTRLNADAIRGVAGIVTGP
jgi:hypothetical protein